MADKNTIKNWFKTGLKPTQAQFWATWDSFWHKDEKIPITAIEDIENILAEKADAEVLDYHLTDEAAHVNLFNAKEDKNKRGASDGYAPLNNFTKLAIEYLNVVNDLVTGGVDSLLTAEQGKLLQNQIDNINVLLTSDNLNLDNVQELVDAIETVQTSLETILVNDLTTGGTTKALTAEMGKTLKGLIDALTASLDNKLTRDGYTGTAQELKTAIDNIYQPDVLISSVAPTRSVNTFTYPAGQYTYLISKVLRTLIANYVVTIDVAASAELKRVDLIQGKADGTFSKKIGTENATIAIRPEPDDNCVPISFINVFGNTIENPTPITKELSIQDYNGVEKFRITDYLRFKGVSFDASAKALVTDPLIPLAAFLDIVNGNDVTASLENSNKPYKTIQALLSALPVTTGETYTIYITGGTIYFTRRILSRNLRFVAYKPTNLDFSNVMENDGITPAKFVFISQIGIWTFENSNISLICNYIGIRVFSSVNNDSCISLRGTIDILNWKSTNEQSFLGVVGLLSSNISIQNLYDSSQNNTIFISSTGAVENIVDIINFRVQYGRGLIREPNLGNCQIRIRNIVQIGSTVIYLTLGNSGQIPKLTLGNITLNGTVQPNAKLLFFDNSVITTNTNVLIGGTAKITGVVASSGYFYSDYIDGNHYFKDFTGKLGLMKMYGSSFFTFENCNLETNTWMLGIAHGTFKTSAVFKLFNSIKQIDTTQPLIKTYAVDNGSQAMIPTKIEIEGTLKSNVLTYGVGVSYNNTLSTFKEKLNEVIVRSKIDLINIILSPTTTYIIDGTITLLSNEYIQVPAGGLTISGYGFDVSKIIKNVAGQSIFSSPVGGSGNFVTNNMEYNSGLGSVFNLTDSDGSHAIELNDINFQSCASLGTLNHYRQFTATTCGIYGCSDGFTLEGAWNGFKLVNTNAFGFGAGGTLVKKGLTTSFANRLYLDLNLSLPTGAKICDFDASNFSSDKLLQVVNCLVKVNGVIDPTTTAATFPNISPFSPKAYFTNNIGIKNSFNEPYGLKTTNMTTYATDVDAATGGIQIGEVYLETSTGYFKTRLS